MLLPNQNEIKHTHKSGWVGLRRAYPWQKFARGARVPFGVSLAISALYGWLATNGMVDLAAVTGQALALTLAIVPSLLGFLLGGYTILVTFGNADTLKMMTTPLAPLKPTFFQLNNGIFAATLLLQVSTILVALTCQVFAQIHPPKGQFEWLVAHFPHINIGGLFLLTFFLGYSVWVLLDVVLNIFNFAQGYHFTLTMKRGEEEKAAAAVAAAAASHTLTSTP